MGGKIPVNFLVYTCPECGWSGQDEHPEPITEEIRRFVGENIKPSLDGSEIRPWRKWEYYALIKEAAGCSGIELGSALLIAAQCARLDGQYDEEKKYRFRAIDSYVKALEMGDVPVNSLYQTTYLIGELYRRVGDTLKAHEWFKKVGSLDVGYDRREFFTNLAQQQMTLPRNYISEEDERKAAKRGKPGLFLAVI